MPAPAFRFTCPHCRAELEIKGAGLSGQTIQCPKCENSLAVEIASSKIEREPAPQPPPEPRRPRARRRTLQRGSGLLALALLGVGAGVIAMIAFVAVLLFRELPATQSALAEAAASAATTKKPSLPPLPGGGADGVWLDPGPFVGFNPPPESVITLHIQIMGDSYKLSGRGISNTEKAITDRLVALTAVTAGQVSASDDDPGGESRRLTVKLGGVRDDPKAFAKKIDFGKVLSVSGRVITMAVRKSDVPPGKPRS